MGIRNKPRAKGILRIGNFMKEEKLVKTAVYLEEEIIEALEEAAKEFEKQTGMKWSKGAVIRVALSDFFTRRGKIL